MSTIIIGLLILLYAGIVVIKRVKAMKQGNYCSCGCKDCSTACNKNLKKNS